MPPLRFFARLKPAHQQTLLLVLGVALTALADYFCPRIVLRHSLVLGGAAYWALLPILGPRKAALILLTHFGTLWLKWGDPYSAGVIAIETVVVGAAWRRGLNPVLTDLVFWAVAGLPLVWWMFRHLLELPQPTLIIAIVLQPLNGLVAIWLAHLAVALLGSAPISRKHRERQGLGRVLLTRYLAFGTIPVLVAGIIVGNAYESNARAAARENVAQLARSATATLSTFLDSSISTIEHEALRQNSAAYYTPANLDEALAELHERNPQFISMLATDEVGTVLAAAPAAARTAIHSGGLNVADRAYFKMPMAERRPFVSPVFRGRGFGSDLLIAISAPCIDRSGQLLGVVEGSLTVGTLRVAIAERIPARDSHIIVTDSSHQIVHTMGLEGTTLPIIDGAMLSRLGKNHGEPRTLTLDREGRRETYVAINLPVPGHQWHVTVLRPMTLVLRPIAYTYTMIIVIGLVTAAFATVFVGWSIRDIVQGFERIRRFSLSSSTTMLRDVDHARLPLEIHAVIGSLHEMAVRAEHEKQRREELLARLETMVSERTKELRHALDLAKSAEKAKDAFLATASHELRTPLTSIVTGTRLLRLATQNQPAAVQRTIQTMEQSSQVLMELISDVLEFSKIQAGGLKMETQEFRPADLARESTEIVRPRTEVKQVGLHLELLYPDDRTWVSDPRRVRQILLNLLGNAVKFTHAGHVTLKSWIDEERLYFSVSDTGGGIPAEMLEAIFEPFVQVDTDRVSSTAGTGLGLTISRRLCEALGGAIDVVSDIGRGTTFTFWVPRR